MIIAIIIIIIILINIIIIISKYKLGKYKCEFIFIAVANKFIIVSKKSVRAYVLIVMSPSCLALM